MTDLKKQFEKLKIYPGYLEWFQSLELPLLRRSAEASSAPNIEVGGDSMRVGKTTAVKVISDGYKRDGSKVIESYEDFASNPYLKESYSDPRNAILHSQQWFATRKNQQIKNAPDKKVFIQDVHPEMDFCYAATNVLAGRMSLSQFEKYKDHYYSLNWESVSQPDVLVYLKVSDDQLLKRAKKSLRDFEEVDENYFLIMKMVNRAWLKKARTHMSIVEVDTDNFDFSTKDEAKKRLVSSVKDKLSLNGINKSTKKSSQVYKSIEDVIPELTKHKVVLLSGVPGSGKSYFANKLKKDHKYSYLSTDVIRFTKIYKNQSKYLKDSNDYVKTRKLTYDILHSTLLKRLREGKKVVVDATYLGPQRKALLSLLKERGLLEKVVFLVVKTNEDTITSRVSLKGKLSSGRSYKDAWSVAYKWFANKLSTGEIRYPDELKDGIKVIEVWNQ